MNKTELINEMAKVAELTKKDAEKALKAFEVVAIEQLVKGEKIHLVGFGTFDVTKRQERQGRNPQTGESITIPACKTPRFKASKLLKNTVNGK